MPRRGPIFISKFLIPNLDNERFGNRLMWLDRSTASFQMLWNHKAAQKWTEYDAEVFTEWDKKKGRYEPTSKEYFSKSKQRFRAMLYKLTNEKHLKELKCSDKRIKAFCIVTMLNQERADAVMRVKPEYRLAQVCRTTYISANVRTDGQHSLVRIPSNGMDLLLHRSKTYSELTENHDFKRISHSQTKKESFQSALQDHLYNRSYDATQWQVPELEEQFLSSDPLLSLSSSPVLHASDRLEPKQEFTEGVDRDGEQSYLPEPGAFSDLYVNLSILQDGLDYSLQMEMGEDHFINYGDLLSRSISDAFVINKCCPPLEENAIKPESFQNL